MANVDITRIASNIGALNTLLSLEQINRKLSTHQARLASGKRINSAADDPAGLTIATKMQARSEGLKVALNNISDAKNLLAVCEAGLGRINDIIVSMRNKVEQAASDTLGVAEREAVLQQLRAYISQVDDIVAQTEWNGNELIDGTYDATALTFQTGAGSADTTSVDGLRDMGATGVGSMLMGFIASADAAEVSWGGGILDSAAAVVLGATQTLDTSIYRVEVSLELAAASDSAVLMDAQGTVLASLTGQDFVGGGPVDFGPNYFAVTLEGVLPADGDTYEGTVGFTDQGDYDVKNDGDGSTGGTYMSTAAQYNTYMSYIEGKLNGVSSQMARVGAFSGRLTFKEDQVAAMQINIEASYSRIMNANMAEEQVEASKYMILQQTAVAMLSQANASPQFLLSLFYAQPG